MSEPQKSEFWPRAASIAAAVMYAVTIDANALPNLLRSLNSGFNPPMFVYSHPISIFIILLISPRVLLGLRGWAEGTLFAAAYGFFAQFMMLFAQMAARQQWTETLIYGLATTLFFMLAGRVDALLSAPRKIGRSPSLEFIIAIILIISVIQVFSLHFFEWLPDLADYFIPILSFGQVVLYLMACLLLIMMVAVYVPLSRSVAALPIPWVNHGLRGAALALIFFLSNEGVKILGPGIGWMTVMVNQGNAGPGMKLTFLSWNLARMAAYGLIFSSLGPIRRDWKGHLAPAILAAALIGIGWIIYFVLSP